MARAPMKLNLKKDKMHKDVGKAPSRKLTSRRRNRGAVSSPSARNLLRTPRSGITPARGNDSAKLASTIHAFQSVVAAVQLNEAYREVSDPFGLSQRAAGRPKADGET
jgi:hypothetical protein